MCALMGCLLSQDIDFYNAKNAVLICSIAYSFSEVLDRKWIILIRLFREVCFDYDSLKLRRYPFHRLLECQLFDLSENFSPTFGAVVQILQCI